MRKKRSMSEKIRRLVEQGYTNKAIIERLNVRPQTVYSVRYHYNKSRGLGAIVPQRELASLPPTPTPTPTPTPEFGYAPIKSEGARIDYSTIQTTREPDEPTWKTRIKKFFRMFRRDRGHG